MNIFETLMQLQKIYSSQIQTKGKITRLIYNPIYDWHDTKEINEFSHIVKTKRSGPFGKNYENTMAEYQRIREEYWEQFGKYPQEEVPDAGTFVETGI